MIPFLKSFKFGLIFNSIAIIVFSFVKLIPKLFLEIHFPNEVSKFETTLDLKHAFYRYIAFTDQFVNIFIFGIIIGYLLTKRKLWIKRFTNNRMSKVGFTILSYSLSFSSIAWSENFKDIDREVNQYNIITWFVLGNLLWSMGMIWTIFILYRNDKSKPYS